MSDKVYDQREDLYAAQQEAARRALPARDPSKPDTEQGLYEKYRVYRTDGLDNVGGPRADDKYFVLNLTRDPHAKPAMAAYAASVNPTHAILSTDMIREVLGGGAIDTLVALIEFGPRESGNIPSKVGLSELIGCACAVQIVAANGEYVYAATMAGSDAYVALFGGATLREAKQRRQADRRKAYDGPVVEANPALTDWAEQMRSHAADEKELERLTQPVASMAVECACGIGLCEGNSDGSCRVQRMGVQT